MKRTKQTPGMDRQPVREPTMLSVADFARVSGGDLYMSNARGSSDGQSGGGGGGQSGGGAGGGW
jgi:hypothetical protein